MSNSSPRPPSGDGNVAAPGRRERTESALLHAVPAQRRYQLPAQPTALTGRQRELAAARQILLRPEVRLLTLLGAPGIGKTHLGIQLALNLEEEYLDGVCFVDLTSIDDPALVGSAIAQSLGLRDEPGRASSGALERALRHRHLLLLLDNFEHVAGAAPEVGVLLGSCPQLKILTTSRVALLLRSEHLFPVPPLGLPGAGRLPSPEALAKYPAVALFVKRARAIKPDFSLDAGNASAVVEICTRLDGLPLAIELAAARVNTLSSQAIAERLHRRLDLLTGRMLDAPARHHTLRDAVSWSYDLLPTDERTLFSRLGVFAGGCDLEAVEAVCSGEGLGVGVLDGLASLIEKSLLRQDEQPDGQPRFRMLETLREYALERLEAGEHRDGAGFRLRHAEHFLALAERAEPQLWGPQLAVWSLRLQGELDNLRAAMAWSAGKGGDPQLGLRLVAALWRFWDMRGLAGEGRRWLSMLLSLAPAPRPERVKALNALSFLAFIQGDVAAMQPPLDEALSVAREIGDGPGLVLSSISLGAVAYLKGDLDLASALLDESLSLVRSSGQAAMAPNLLIWRALVCSARGERERATELLEEGLGISREIGDLWTLAHTLSLLGQAERQSGKRMRARALFRESLAIRRGLDDRWGIAASLLELAHLADEEGQWGRAGRLWGAAEALREDLGAIVLPSFQGDLDFGVNRARAGLGEERFAAVEAAGRTMPLAEAIADGLETLGRSPSVTEQQPPAAPQSPLTEREREVAVLIARGRTNHEVATDLVISRRTAEAHAASILKKLGLASRAQIGVWVAEAGLLR
jgi:predicted ATPase/DNA-binding CsgD family transcriptional regulator